MTQEISVVSDTARITGLGVEGQIIFMQQPGLPAMWIERQEHELVLTWEESIDAEYVPQFTVSLGHGSLWRQITAPIQHHGTLRRVKLQPYCHSRLFRLVPRTVKPKLASFVTRPARPACPWWRRWLSQTAEPTLMLFLAASTCNLQADPLDTWHPRSSPDGNTNSWRGIAFGNNRFVVVGEKAANVLTSTDGAEWTFHTTTLTKGMAGIAYGNGTFVAGGQSGKVFVSTDGQSWTPGDTGTSAHFNNLDFANGRFFAAGDGGAIYSSLNGLNWTSHKTASSNYWHGVAFGNNTYAAVGWDYKTGKGRVGASDTLAGWDTDYSGSIRYLSGVIFGAGKFVACGYGGVVQTSVNGQEWTPPIQPVVAWLNRITYANGTFVAVGEFGALVTSPDGTNWTPRKSGTRETLEAVASGNGTFVAVGWKGLILQSEPAAASGAIRLSNPVSSPAEFTFKFDGEIGQTYEVQTSADLVQWTSLGNVTCTASPVQCNHAAINSQNSFYRVVKR